MKDEEKSREQLLSESLELLQQVVERDRILNLSNDLICVMGADGYFKYLNLAWERALGYSREELFSRSVFDFVQHDDRHNNYKDFVALLASGKQNIDYENHLIHKDGSIRIVSWTATPLPEEGLIYCIGRDITEHKQAEEALLESEKKFRKLTEAAFGGIAITEKGKFIDVSDQLAVLFGYQRSELNGKYATDVIAPEFRAEAVQKMLTGYDKPYDSSCLRKDGTTFPVEVCGKNFYSQGRELRITAIRDITERKQVEKEMQQREKELEVKSKNLEEVNTALKVLLKRMDEDKIELEEKVLLNVKEMIVPYLEKLKMSGLNERQKTYVGILESSLHQIISPFSLRMSSKFFNFTPKELQVANLLKQGKTNKEIGELLNSSPRTIACHRESIRKKLGLKNKKANLKSYLLSVK